MAFIAFSPLARASLCGELTDPPVAGLLLAIEPESVCFLINPLSYFGPIYAVLAIRAQMPGQQNLKTGSALLEVWSYIRQSFEAKVALAAIAMVNATASSYIVLMPVFARDVFAGNAQSLGILLGMGGAGALTASIYLSSRARSGIAIAFLDKSCGLASLGMIGFALAGELGNIWRGMPMVALMGAGIGATNIAGNTRLQFQAPDSLRGRVISIFGSLRFGCDALGGLLAGAVAAHFGVLPVTLGLGVLLLLGSALLKARLASGPEQ